MEVATLLPFIFFTGLVGLITWRMTRRDDHGSSTGYFLAGRTLTAGFIAGSLMLTNLSTEQLVALNADAFKYGLCVFAWEVIAAVALVCMALFFLPKFLRSGIATVPQFLEERFDHNTRTITTIIFIVAYAAILLPIILYTGARGMAGILDISSITGIEDKMSFVSISGEIWNLCILIVFIGVIGSLYAIFGGLRTVAVSDTLNGFGLLVGGVMIVLFGLNALGGDGGIFKGLEIVRTQHPEMLNSIDGSKDLAIPFGTLFTGVLLLNLFYWCTNQQIIQRTLGANSLKEGQKGVLFAGFLKVLAPLILVLPGIIAFHMFSNGSLSIPLKEGAPNTARAYGALVKHVLPTYLSGFFAAVLLGAILSSFNSALNSTCTLFSLGMYKGVFKKGATEAQVVNSGKLFGWIIAISSMCIAPLLAGQESIFGYLQQMNAIYFIPIFSVVLMALFYRRATALAANIGLVFAFLAIVLVYFVPGLQNVIDPKSGSFLIHKYHFMGAVFVATLLLIAVISLVKPRSEPWEHKYSGDVDMTPWKYAKLVGAILVAIVLGIYAYFADFSVLT